MKGKAPECILTDQAGAMKKALSKVMPSTRHRRCLWHIMQKLPKRLGSYKRHREFINELKDLIYDSLSAEEFERRWNELVNNNEFGSNEWLQYMYKYRAMWIPAYHTHKFWEG